MNYYDLYVRFDDEDGYSIFFQSEKLLTLAEAVEHAKINDLFTEDGDIEFADRLTKISQEDYELAIGPKAALNLTIRVRYDRNGVRVKELEEMLYQAAHYLFGNGMITCNTEATVDRWGASVERVQ